MENWTHYHTLFVGGFSSLVAICVTIGCTSVIRRTPASDLARLWYEALPLVTAGIIVAAVYALAVVGVVHETTISTIYGSIAGFVLGRTSSRRSARRPSPEKDS